MPHELPRAARTTGKTWSPSIDSKKVPCITRACFNCTRVYLIVLQEIQERKDFLGEMEQLGQRSAYQSQLSTEISQKIRELELIDKKRCLELRF